MGEKCEETRSLVLAKFDNLKRELEIALEGFATLRQKIEPILAPREEKEGVAEDRPKPFRISDHIQDAIDMVMSLNRQIEDVKKRLEI